MSPNSPRPPGRKPDLPGWAWAVILALFLLAWLAIPARLFPNYTPNDKGGGVRITPAPLLAMFGFGFLLAAGGHLYKSRFVVGLGIAIVFLSLVLIPIALVASGSGG